MTRAKQREQAFILIFESIFCENDCDSAIELFKESVGELGKYAEELYRGVSEKTDELDLIISDYSNGRKLARISKINLAVLRLALYEIKYCEGVPDSVAINEAVELTKTYSTKEDSSFVNGVLGAYVRSNA